MLKHFQTMYRSDSDYLTKLLFLLLFFCVYIFVPIFCAYLLCRIFCVHIPCFRHISKPFVFFCFAFFLLYLILIFVTDLRFITIFQFFLILLKIF